MVKKIGVAIIALFCACCVYMVFSFINTYNIEQMQYLYEVKGVQYDREKENWQREKSMIPWGINKRGLKIISGSINWEFKEEDENSLEYLKTTNMITCSFNEKGQFFKIKESITLSSTYYKDEESIFDGFVNFIEEFLDEEGYTSVFNDEKTKHKLINVEISWTDKEGKPQKRILKDFNKNDLKDFLYNENLVIKVLRQYNSVTIEQTLRKDEKDNIFEFILTNIKL